MRLRPWLQDRDHSGEPILAQIHCSIQILNTEHSHNNYATAYPDYLNILKMYVTSTQYTKNLTDVAPCLVCYHSLKIYLTSIICYLCPVISLRVKIYRNLILSYSFWIQGLFPMAMAETCHIVMKIAISLLKIMCYYRRRPFPPRCKDTKNIYFQACLWHKAPLMSAPKFEIHYSMNLGENKQK